MFYLVLFYKFLITNECGTVFGRQGPEVHKIAWSDFGPRSDPQGEAQGCAESNLFTPTKFSFIELVSCCISSIQHVLTKFSVPEFCLTSLTGKCRHG